MLNICRPVPGDACGNGPRAREAWLRSWTCVLSGQAAEVVVAFVRVYCLDTGASPTAS